MYLPQRFSIPNASRGFGMRGTGLSLTMRQIGSISVLARHDVMVLVLAWFEMIAMMELCISADPLPP